jgi:hypothetical protein
MAKVIDYLLVSGFVLGVTNLPNTNEVASP